MHALTARHANEGGGAESKVSGRGDATGTVGCLGGEVAAERPTGPHRNTQRAEARP